MWIAQILLQKVFSVQKSETSMFLSQKRWSKSCAIGKFDSKCRIIVQNAYIAWIISRLSAFPKAEDAANSRRVSITYALHFAGFAKINATNCNASPLRQMRAQGGKYLKGNGRNGTAIKISWPWNPPRRNLNFNAGILQEPTPTAIAQLHPCWIKLEWELNSIDKGVSKGKWIDYKVSAKQRKSIEPKADGWYGRLQYLGLHIRAQVFKFLWNTSWLIHETRGRKYVGWTSKSHALYRYI